MPADPLKTNTSASRAACLFVLRFAFALFGLTGLLLGTVTGLPNSLGTQVHSPCVYDGYARRQGCAVCVPPLGFSVESGTTTLCSAGVCMGDGILSAYPASHLRAILRAMIPCKQFRKTFETAQVSPKVLGN